MAKVMLIDDDRDFLEIQRGVLEARGHEVVTVEGSRNAIAEAREVQPDVIVVDLMMEEDDAGFALCYQFKKGAAGKVLPVIMVTGVATDRGIPFGLDTTGSEAWIKADMYLAKPIRPEELIAAVEKFAR